ncbi:MAG: hypothetical protein ACR2PR_00780 [Pseudohongiellaceae bacterium]
MQTSQSTQSVLSAKPGWLTQRVLVGILFACSSVMLAILVAIFLAEPAVNAVGLPHPEIAGMRIGGDGAARLAAIGPLAFVFHCLILVLVAVFVALGVRERHRDGLFLFSVLGTFLLQLFVCWQMWASHQQFMETGETIYVMGFPLTTAWMVYGVWASALPLAVLYCWGFKRYVYSAEDEQAFAELMAQAGEQESDETLAQAQVQPTTQPTSPHSGETN